MAVHAQIQMLQHQHGQTPAENRPQQRQKWRLGWHWQQKQFCKSSLKGGQVQGSLDPSGDRGVPAPLSAPSVMSTSPPIPSRWCSDHTQPVQSWSVWNSSVLGWTKACSSSRSDPVPAHTEGRRRKSLGKWDGEREQEQDNENSALDWLKVLWNCTFREKVWEGCWQKGAVNKGLYAAIILETGFAISLRTHQFHCIPELIFINQVSKSFYFFLKSTRSNISCCAEAGQWGVVQQKLVGLLWLKGLPRFLKDMAVLLPQKEQIIPGSIGTKNPWTFLMMREMLVRGLWTRKTLPAHQGLFKPLLVPRALQGCRWTSW